jgi:hypothetical protein
MTIKYTNIFHFKTLQYLFTQIGIFGFENIQSANPDMTWDKTQSCRILDSVKVCRYDDVILFYINQRPTCIAKKLTTA